MSDKQTEINSLANILASYNPIHKMQDSIPFALVPEGYRRESLEKSMAAPFRIEAAPQFWQIESFCDYISRFSNPKTRLFSGKQADPGAPLAVLAIFDYHLPDAPAWGCHTAKFTSEPSLEWQRWTDKNNCLMSQADFVRFLEENRTDIVEPDGAGIMDIANSLSGHMKVEFLSGVRLHDGTTQLTYKETTETAAKNHMRLPEKFILGIPVLEGGDLFKIEVFLRFRLNEGRVHFFYEMHRADYLMRQISQDMLQKIEALTGRAIWRANP